MVISPRVLHAYNSKAPHHSPATVLFLKSFIFLYSFSFKLTLFLSQSQNSDKLHGQTEFKLSSDQVRIQCCLKRLPCGPSLQGSRLRQVLRSQEWKSPQEDPCKYNLKAKLESCFIPASLREHKSSSLYGPHEGRCQRPWGGQSCSGWEKQ